MTHAAAIAGPGARGCRRRPARGARSRRTLRMRPAAAVRPCLSRPREMARLHADLLAAQHPRLPQLHGHRRRAEDLGQHDGDHDDRGLGARGRCAGDRRVRAPRTRERQRRAASPPSPCRPTVRARYRVSQPARASGARPAARCTPPACSRSAPPAAPEQLERALSTPTSSSHLPYGGRRAAAASTTSSSPATGAVLARPRRPAGLARGRRLVAGRACAATRRCSTTSRSPCRAASCARARRPAGRHGVAARDAARPGRCCASTPMRAAASSCASTTSTRWRRRWRGASGDEEPARRRPSRPRRSSRPTTAEPTARAPVRARRAGDRAGARRRRSRRARDLRACAPPPTAPSPCERDPRGGLVLVGPRHPRADLARARSATPRPRSAPPARTSSSLASRATPASA